MQKNSTVSIIIPVYNEGATIQEVLTQVLSLTIPEWKIEVIVVDDGSTDATARELKGFPAVRVCTHKRRMGKGAAMATGVLTSRGSVILFQDADLEYHPNDIPRLMKAYKKKRGVVYGSRRLKKNPYYSRMYLYGASLLTFLVNVRYNANLTDIFTGYKLIPRDVIRHLDLASTGFEIEMEITTKLLDRGCPITEIPISYTPRGHRQGKKLGVYDGVKSLHTFLKHAIL